MRSRLRFLMELVLDYNETHEKRATFRMDADGVMVYVEDPQGDKTLMIEGYSLRDVTEETVYEIYKKLKKETDTTEQ